MSVVRAARYGKFHVLSRAGISFKFPHRNSGGPACQLVVTSIQFQYFNARARVLLRSSKLGFLPGTGQKSLMYAVLLAAIGFAPIRSTFFHAQPQLFLQRVQAQQTFTTSRSGRVACMETHTKAADSENGLPDEQTLSLIHISEPTRPY